MKSTVWWHWYIVWLKLNKKKKVQCDGTGTKCDGTFYEWTEKVQCEGTGTLYIKKRTVQCDGTDTGIWSTNEKKYSVRALVHCVLNLNRKKEVQCDGTGTKVRWHLFMYEQKVQCEGTGTLHMREKEQCDGTA